VILGRPLEDAFDKLAKGLNLGWFYIDEMTEANEEIWSGLEGRLRRAGVRHTGFGTTNPEGHDWVWKKFISQPVEDDFIVISPSTDNIYLPEGYIDGLISRYPEEWVKRYVYGSTETFEGLVYKDFQDKAPFVIPPCEIPDGWYRFVGMDHGYRNPTAVLWGAVDPKGNLLIYDEFYETQHVVSELTNVIKAKTGKDKVQLYLIDPSCANRNGQTGRSVIDEFNDWGLYFLGANNDVRAGINHVQEYLKKSEGRPRIQIFSNCRNLRTELQTYRGKDLKIGAATDSPERPVKKGDHAVDALRYMVNYLYGMPSRKPAEVGWRKWMKARQQTEDHWMAA
jgi:PBSX family phage terminase large subunit